jgi:polyisoprenoid-binding protein YceI
MKSSTRVPVFAALLAALFSNASAAVETYTIDPVHSSVAFNIRHFVAKVPGKFNNFSGTIKVDRQNPANNSAEATIQTTSIDTDNQKRDTHLRSADFLEVANFPAMSFKSKSWKQTGEGTFDVVGDLTIKDVTKEVVLKVTSLGFGPGAAGAQLSGWEATTKINKKEFNVKDPAMLDAALGDDVAVTINIEAKKV